MSETRSEESVNTEKECDEVRERGTVAPSVVFGLPRLRTLADPAAKRALPVVFPLTYFLIRCVHFRHQEQYP